jgi:nitrous oxide reductase accessory protein NosL
MRFPIVNRYGHILMKAASPFILVLLLFTAPSLAHPAEREGCAICGMYLDVYAKTRFEITLTDGSSRSACGMACAVRIIDANRDRIREVRVADYRTGALIVARDAFFLEGSDVPGVMSYTGRIAFSTRAEAADFQKKHGGKIMTFENALKNQRSDRE